MVRSLLVVTLACSAALSAPAQAIKKGTPRAAPAVASHATPPVDTTAASGDSVVVSGFVLDSLRELPLAGATVLISGTTFAAKTDLSGRFRLVVHGLADGVYKVGFFHPTLDSLGISPPTQQVAIVRGKASFVQLYVPSAHTVVSAACPDSSRGGDRGLVMGVVRDASSELPLKGVRVVLMWTGVSIAANSVLKVPQATSVLTDDMGTFRACRVPTETPLRLQARSKSGSSGWVEVSVPATGLALRDVLLGDREAVVASAPPAAGAPGHGDTASAVGAPAGGGAAAPHLAPLGSAMLTGQVTSAEGKPLEGAMVLLLGTQLSARSDATGSFRLSGLPAGTQSVEVREIGFSPKRFAVDLSPKRPSTLLAALDQRTNVLKTMEITAKRGSEVPGFDQRKRSGLGYYMDRDQIERSASISTTDLFRQVPGLTVVWDGEGYSIEVNRTSNAGSCPVQYYIDGTPFLSQGDDIDQVVQPQEIAAIEVYKSSAETPMEFQGATGAPCGTIVIWTKRRIGNDDDTTGDH
ncbi:MAG TPA: carboxypeptidase regulatory-like domain-containing protein [Gemmatimonadaceae bacterium]|nr:carboxypeptidase regulatory-like domain-containing protein [Gemmatimonadaceae bacterium]